MFAVFAGTSTFSRRTSIYCGVVILESAGLKGTKIGCNEGGCGACTVMVSRYDRVTKSIRYILVLHRLYVSCCWHPLFNRANDCVHERVHNFFLSAVNNFKSRPISGLLRLTSC